MWVRATLVAWVMDTLTASQTMVQGSTSSKDFWVVVTDMDGTLLDHHTYAHDQALPALNELRRLNIPLVFNTSKTRMEMVSFAASLGVKSPMVVENGGGIFIPEQRSPRIFWSDPGNFPRRGQWISLGIPRNEIQVTLQIIRNRKQIAFRSFSELSIAALQEITGLSRTAAEAAQNRDFSEPLIWEGNDADLKGFKSALQREGLQISKGGRFYTVSGSHDKGKAVHWLRSYFGFKSDARVRVVVLGDGQNDLPMLEAGDVSVAVKSPVNPILESRSKKLLHTNECGPLGWNESVLDLLQQMGCVEHQRGVEKQSLSNS